MAKVWGQGSSTMVRRQLGRRLRDLRVQARKTQEDVAATRLMSLGKLKLIEHGRSMVRSGDVYELCQIYGADDTTATELRALATATTQDGWWQPYAAGLVKGFTTYLDLESSASRLSIFSPILVHGLLQTREYALLVQDATVSKLVTPEERLRHVELRLQRLPALLARVDPPTVHIVLGESAFRARVPDERAMQDQVDHLCAVAALDNVTISVLPFSIGVHQGWLGPFSLLDFDDADDPSVAYVESYAGARYDDQAASVTRHREVFEDLTAKSVPLKEFLHDQ